MGERFEDRATEFVATAAALFQNRGHVTEARALKSAKAELERDGWNDEVAFFRLIVRIPVADFARVPNESKFEAAVLEIVRRLVRDEANVWVSEVLAKPDLSLEPQSDIAPTESEPWPAHGFRLFISHCSSIKVKAEGLKEALQLYRIAGFVAHSDIEPTREWQNVIEAALQSMDALAAVVTPDFVASRWCDQKSEWRLADANSSCPLGPVQTPTASWGSIKD